jgi:hypothetical protein
MIIDERHSRENVRISLAIKHSATAKVKSV